MDSLTALHGRLRVDDGELPVTYFRGAGTGAVVVIVPSAFGVTPDLEEQMSELAADASLVVSFDPLFGRDAGVVDVVRRAFPDASHRP